jgi:hypothetical protein
MARDLRTTLSHLALAAAMLAAPPAMSDEAAKFALIAVEVDRSRFIDVPPETRTIAIGNPAIADTLIVGRNLVLTGKATGSTNLIVADAKGQMLFSAEISVTPAASGIVRVYRRTERRTLHCAPLCEPFASPGDQTGTAGSPATSVRKAIGADGSDARHSIGTEE